MKKYTTTVILIISIFFLVENVNGQKGLKNASFTTFVETENEDPFLISTKPITNREYIIYLSWLYHVYIDYPSVYLLSLPEMDEEILNEIYDEYYSENTVYYNFLEYYFRHVPEYVKNYMFNPQYLDYPVVGLSWTQASKFCQWMTDRYNEYNLIKNKFLKENINQINEDCFVSESYLLQQYVGLKRNKGVPNANWNDRIMIPAFRLPTTYELSLAKNENLVSQEFKPYEQSKKDFLILWQNWFLEISDSEIVFKNYTDDLKVTTDPKVKSFAFDKLNAEEFVLDFQNKNFTKDIVEIYKQNGQQEVDFGRNIFSKGFFENIYKEGEWDMIQEKDSLGMLPFIIIDESENKVPVLVENYKKSNPFDSNKKKLYFFRYACSLKP